MSKNVENCRKRNFNGVQIPVAVIKGAGPESRGILAGGDFGAAAAAPKYNRLPLTAGHGLPWAQAQTTPVVWACHPARGKAVKLAQLAVIQRRHAGRCPQTAKSFRIDKKPALSLTRRAGLWYNADEAISVWTHWLQLHEVATHIITVGILYP